MPTAVEQKPLTVTQRAAEAAREAGEFLGLDDLKRMSAALAEAAVDGIRRNQAFAAHVRKLYEDMAPKPAAKKKTPSARVAPDVELIPRKQMEGYRLDPGAPPDPYFLNEYYGSDQLALALARYDAPALREAVKPVKRRHPGTKPKGTSRQALIDYIIDFVATPEA